MKSRTHKLQTGSRVEGGQALVPVIMVVLILTVLAVAFTTSANRELKAASNFESNTEETNAARGIVNYVMSALGQISNNGWTYGIVPPGPDTDANGWMQIGNAWVKYDVTDTASCININSVSAATLERMTVFAQNPQVADAVIDWRTPETTATSDGAKSDYYQGLTPPYNCKDAPFDTVEELLLVKGVTPTILYGSAAGNPISADDALTNSQSGANGIIVGTPGTSSRQAAARPNTSATPGATSGIGGAGRPGGATGGAAGGVASSATAGDTDWDDIYTVSTIPLAELFTTVSVERQVAADGTARVNINTAQATDLQNVGLSSTLANAIVRQRTSLTTATGAVGGIGGPGGGGGTTPARPGGAGGAPAGGGARPPSGRQAVVAQPGGAARPGGTNGANGTGGAGGNNKPGGTGGGVAAASTGAQAFTSIGDLLKVPGFSPTVMQQVADYLSIDSNQYHGNVVNINTAPAEVLATVPGMDHTTLNAIVTFRQNGQAFQTMGDFFALPGLTTQEIQNVAASLTAKSSIYRVRVKVKTAGQHGIYAVTAYVEMTDNGPQIISWRETPRSPGWAYWVPSPVLPMPTAGSAGTTTGP